MLDNRGWSARVRSVGAFVRSAGLDLAYPLLVLVVVGILSGLGLSGSSIALLSESGKPDSQAVVVGTPRVLRSDEWLVDSPLRTGRVRADFPAGNTYGMGTPDVNDSWQPLLPARNVGAALYSPFNLPLLLPLAQGFALSWWLPFAACALGLYAWLRAMRVGKWVALAASLITVFSPAVEWWSTSLVIAIASAVVPCALLIGAARVWSRRPRLAVGTAILAGLAAAGLPWWYQPWSLVAGVFVGGVTLLWGLSDPQRRRPFVFTALLAGAIFVGEELVYLVHERAYYEALTNTVYPGARRLSGGGVPFWKLFTSIVPFSFLGKTGTSLRTENFTELAMGWTLALPVSIAVGILGRRGLRGDRDRTLIVGTGLLALVLSSWCVVAWPTILAKITFLDYVPPSRMAPFVGFFGTVLLALLLGPRDRRERVLGEISWVGALGTGGVMAVLVAWEARAFRDQALPGLSRTAIGLAVLATAVVVTLLCTRWWGAAAVLATVLAISSGVLVNPLVQGAGALDNSGPARLVRHLDRTQVAPTHGAWAADSPYVDGLLNGEGVNSLSSFNNPVDEKGWRVLDPHGTYEKQWNRFAYISFDWDPAMKGVRVQNPELDNLIVSISPCSERLAKLHLRMVVSSHPLDASCLVPVGRFKWMGATQSVYRRKPSPVASLRRSGPGPGT
jgi:hypothetical protein